MGRPSSGGQDYETRNCETRNNSSFPAFYPVSSVMQAAARPIIGADEGRAGGSGFDTQECPGKKCLEIKNVLEIAVCHSFLPGIFETNCD